MADQVASLINSRKQMVNGVGGQGDTVGVGGEWEGWVN